MEEIWKDIPGYEGLYQVSNLGRIKSLDRKYKCKNGLERTIKGKIMSPGYNYHYLQVRLNKNFEKKMFMVHRLMWETFNGSIPEDMEVNHIDENKTNNCLENLNLLSHKDNINWGTHNERVSETMTNGKLSKQVIQLSKNNEILHFYPSVCQAARETGIGQAHISLCCLGKQGKAGGYIWKFAEY